MRIMAKEGNPTTSSTLDSLLATPFHTFFQKHSLGAEIEGFEGFGGLFSFSTETEYVEALARLTTKGGIQIAVAGGLDPVLGQIGQACPDLTLLCDVNVFATSFIHRRLAMLERAGDGQQYWQLTAQEFNNDRQYLGIGLPVPIDRDYQAGGWSAPKHYQAVKAAWQRGAIKLVNADITDGGIKVGLKVARETQVPIKLIHVSNVFDYPDNWDRFDRLRHRVNQGLTEGLVSRDTQVVSATIVRDLATEVQSVQEYFAKHPVYDYKSTFRRSNT